MASSASASRALFMIIPPLALKLPPHDDRSLVHGSNEFLNSSTARGAYKHESRPIELGRLGRLCGLAAGLAAGAPAGRALGHDRHAALVVHMAPRLLTLGSDGHVQVHLGHFPGHFRPKAKARGAG